MKRTLLVALLALAACGGSESSPRSLTECFLISMQTPAGSHCEGALNLEQRGDDLTGSYQCTGERWDAGEVTGIVDGDRVILQLWDPARPGRPLYQVDARVDRGAMVLSGDAHAVPLFQGDATGAVYEFHGHLD